MLPRTGLSGRQDLIVSAHNLVRLTTPHGPGRFTDSAAVPPLETVTITRISRRVPSQASGSRLRWLTPSSIRYLALPVAASIPAAFLLSFFETHISRWLNLREARLTGCLDCACWADAEWDALKALGEEHRFVVTPPLPCHHCAAQQRAMERSR